MDVPIENWLKNAGYDISLQAIEDDIWDNIEHRAEEFAQESINDAMDDIGQEIVLMFNLKKAENKTQGDSKWISRLI